jgi:hypothetical protein
MKSAPSIAFDYTPSRWIAAAASVVVFVAVVSPWLSGVSWRLGVVLSLAALIGGLVAVKRFSTTDVRRIAYQASGWKLVDAAGAEHSAELLSHALFGKWVALDFRSASRRRSRALLGPDNADAETRRRLILLLARAEVAQAGS